MKFIPIIFVLLPLATHASEHIKYCEDGITLDKAYQFYVYQENCDHEAGLVAVRHTQSGKEGYVNYQGNIVIPAQFDAVYGFSEGLSLVKQNGKYGYINPKGKVIIKPTYIDAWGFTEGLAKVEVAGNYGFINKTGKFVIKPTPKLAKSGNAFTDGLLMVSSAGKWGYWDKTGKLKIPYTYDTADYFAEGRAVVGKQQDNQMLYGHINVQGEVTTPIKYIYASSFLDGVAMIHEGNTLRYITPKGDTAPTPDFAKP